MRLMGTVAQFLLLIFAFRISGALLPNFVLIIFTWIAETFLCFSLALWIIELAQDCFFTSKVEVKNKAVLVTGCDTGFGNAFAKILDKRGYQVFACCYDKLGEGACNLKEVCTNRLTVIGLDVTKKETVEEAVRIVENSLDKSDLWAVVNNAGVLKGFQTELCSMKDYEDCIEVNTLGMIRVTKAFLPLLRRYKGRIVNVCSTSGRFRGPHFGAYTVSKTAAVAFTDVLRQEMREFGMRVISIEPEFFKSPMCSEKYVKNVVEQSLDHVNEDIKLAFGTYYIKKAEQIFIFLACHGCPNVKPVLDALEAAISLQNPSDVYKPCRNFLVRIIVFIGERVPQVYVDLIVMFVQRIFGLPKPSTGTDILTRLFKM